MDEVIKTGDLKNLLEEKTTLVCYALPSVVQKDNPLHFKLGTFIEDEFILLETGIKEIFGEKAPLVRAGMKLTLVKISNHIDIKFRAVKAPKEWILGGSYLKTPVYHGQSVLIAAKPESGKSYVTRKLCDSFDSDINKKRTNTVFFRSLFGERRTDDLGKNTIFIDSSGPIDYQIKHFYKILTLALREAWQGRHVVFAIDSLSRMIERLSNKYSGSHMTSGGISASVIKMVEDFFGLGAEYEDGAYLTLVGTCLWTKSSNSWKNIYNRLAAAANAEMHPNIRSGAQDTNRVHEAIKDFNVNLFGILSLHY